MMIVPSDVIECGRRSEGKTQRNVDRLRNAQYIFMVFIIIRS